eukprot:TRINITY_DN11928_c0_g1_i1.p1 TRINITY_DN11928_c0_g1~~TRINITY_DN11928_c0_g1_i1.p1  ORF type:complete len:994 (+),score=217.65 TRINITY_DN11928_c0_g1_i1:357-3338(+)
MGTFTTLDPFPPLNLTSLVIVSTQLRTLPGDLLRRLPLLQHFQADGTLFSLADDLFQANPLLQSIDLGNNRLTQFPSGLIPHLSNLSRIRLSHNAFHPTSLLSNLYFDRLTTLTHLDFDNAFSYQHKNDIYPALEKFLPNTIQQLLLRSVHLTQIPSQIFASPDLKRLELAYNQLTAFAGPNGDEQLPASVEVFVANGNPFRKLRADFFAQATGLKSLVLSNTQLSDIGDLSQLRVLEVLDVSTYLSLAPTAFVKEAKATPASISVLPPSRKLVYINMDFLALLPGQSISDLIVESPLTRIVLGMAKPYELVKLPAQNVTTLDVARMKASMSEVLPMVERHRETLEALVIGGKDLCTSHEPNLNLDLRDYPQLINLIIEDTLCVDIAVTVGRAIINVEIVYNSELKSVNLLIPAGISLMAANISINPKLHTYNYPSSDVLDISGTSITPDHHRACIHAGSNRLYAQNLKIELGGMDVVRILRSCISAADYVDLSRNDFDVVLDTLNHDIGVPILSQRLYTLLTTRYAKSHVDVNAQQAIVRDSSPSIYLEPSPIVCTVRSLRGDVNTHANSTAYQRFDIYYQKVECSCSQSYHLDDSGTCTIDEQPLSESAILAMATIAVLLVISVLLTWVQRLRQTVIQQQREQAELERDKAHSYATLLQKDNQALESWEIDPFDVIPVKYVADGTFADVVQVEHARHLCFKLLKASATRGYADGTADFEREIKFLRRHRHENLVRFYGAGRFSSQVDVEKMIDGKDGDAPDSIEAWAMVPGPSLPQRFLMMEFAKHGSLQNYWKSAKALNQIDEQLPWSRRYRFLYDIASGVAYIHSIGPDSMHRDLKTDNVLICEHGNGELVAKVSDFGTIRFRTDLQRKSIVRRPEQRQVQDPIGTLEYMAPEILNDEGYDQRVDVFSFGVIMWELAALQQPDLLQQEGIKPGGPAAMQMMSLYSKGCRLQPPKAVEEAYSMLYQQCVSALDAPRLDSSKLLNELDRFV